MKYKLVSKKPLIIFLSAIVIIAGAFFSWKKYDEWRMRDENLSLANAGKIGEITTHKLLVKIEKPKCPPEQMKGCYERGDIVLIKPGDWQFSTAEKEGFLILRMDITDKQAEVLVRSIARLASTSGRLRESRREEKSPEMMETVKMRKYAVDLSKIGIAEDDEKGREIEDKIFKWDVVEEK